MFSSLLPDNDDYRIFFSDYAKRHYIKRFAKDYPGKRWIVTQDSICQDLKRISVMQQSQQVDELKSGEGCKLFKYDFAVAQSGVSPKASGNRCIVFLGTNNHRQDVLLVYGKGDISKNQSETVFIETVVKTEFPDFWNRLY